MSYSNRLVSEATLQEADRLGTIGEALIQTGHECLATMARRPNVIAAVNKARAIIPKQDWAELNRPSAILTTIQRDAAAIVWKELPGYTCLMDAVTILARL